MSLGIVSSVARQLEPDSPMIYVQTDAAINPGSSGGPLVDLRQVQVALYRRLAGEIVALDLLREGHAVQAKVMALNRPDGIGPLASADALKPGAPVVLQLERHGSLRYLAFTLEW